MKESHLYPGKAVNFVIGAKVVAGHFTDNVSELSAERTNWTPAYALEIDKKVDNLAGIYMGTNTRDELFKTTLLLNGSLGSMRKDLISLKTHIDVDFKGTPDYLIFLSDLGFKKSISSLTQSEFVALLTKCKSTLTPEYITKITAKGMNTALPQRIAANADVVISNNAKQERLKGTVKEATGKMVADLNDLYKEIIGICKLAAVHYKGNPDKKELFTFSKILSNIGDSRPAKKDEKAKAA